MKQLRFYYVNHRGEGHVYVVEPESVQFFMSGKDEGHWVLNAAVSLRGDKPHPEQIENGLRPRRSFKLAGLQSVTEVEI